MKVTKVNISKRRRNIFCIRVIKKGISIFNRYVDDDYTIREIDYNNSVLVYEYHSWWDSTFDIRPAYYNLRKHKQEQNNLKTFSFVINITVFFLFLFGIMNLIF